MRNIRIKKAIDIIKYAINNDITIPKACAEFGFSRNYVKNIKYIVVNYNNLKLDKNLVNEFINIYSDYLNRSKTNNKNNENNELKNNIIELDDKIKINELIKKNDNIIENETEIEWSLNNVSIEDNYPINHVKTLDDLLKITKVDLNIWDVKEYKVNKWDVTAIIDKKPKTFQNFQVKALLQKNKQTSKEFIVGEIFKEMVKGYKPFQINDIKINYNEKENNLLELTLFDLHLGKLAWGGETGEDYDTKIARERFIKTIISLMKRASGFSFNKILFPVGNDFFNSDTIFNTTTKGTYQDEDLRWQKTFRIGTRLIVDAINILKQTGVPIDVIIIPGNHDYERSFYLGEYLIAWFNNDPMVMINNGASPRKYYKFGKVLLGYTHGNEEKENALPLLMATDIESKPMWSETIFHEWHVGHYHRKRDIKYVTLGNNKMTDENLGVTIRYLSSLSGTEQWHHRKGYVGNIKAGEAFIWNDEQGLIAHLNANLIL